MPVSMILSGYLQKSHLHIDRRSSPRKGSWQLLVAFFLQSSGAGPAAALALLLILYAF